MKLNNIKESKLFKKGEPITMTVFPKTEAMMTGVICIRHTDCKYLIEYSDRTAEETIYISEEKSFQENLFSFVSTIQDAARCEL